MKDLMRQILMLVAQLRAAAGKFLTGLPFWPDLVRVSTQICAPVVNFARWTLAAMPSLRKAEWLLEIESLTKRHPVTMAVSLAFVFFRGIKTTSLGHIGTDSLIYPFLAAVSGFNPFLGLTCGVAYGVGDLTQKILWNDMYGTQGWGWTDTAYWGGVFGYVLAYSSTMTMGLLPGMMSRTFRLGARYLIARFAFRKAAAAADGARPPAWNDPPLPEKERREAESWGAPSAGQWGAEPVSTTGDGGYMAGHLAGAKSRAEWGATSAPITGDGGYMAGHLAGAKARADWGATSAPTTGDGGYMAGHLAGAKARAEGGATSAPTTGDGGYMAGHLAGTRAQQSPSARPVTALFQSIKPVEENPAYTAAWQFHASLQKDPKLQAEIRALQADPRNLLADPNAWRSADLTPRQKTLLGQLRGQRLLGPEGNQRLDQLLGGQPAAFVPPASHGGYDSVDLPPGPPRGDGGGMMNPWEFLAGMLGGSLASIEHMLVNAPAMEAPAFYLRGPGRNDISCHRLEVDKYLHGRAPELGLVGAGAGAIDSLSKAGGSGGPGGGGGGLPGGGSSPEDIWNRINEADNFNFGAVDSETGAEMTRLINKLRDDFRNGKLNEADLLELERMQGRLTAQNKADLDQRFVTESDEHQKLVAELDAAKAREAAAQARLRDEYDRIIKKYTNGGLESAEAMDTIDNWRDRVVKNGVIDQEALDNMTRILGGKTRNLGQRDFDLATAVADAADRQMKAAQLVRDTAWTVAGGLGGSMLGAIPALQAWGLGGSALINAGLGGVTAGATAVSDYWGDPNLGQKVIDAVKTGTLFGGGLTLGIGGATKFMGTEYANWLTGGGAKNWAEWIQKNPGKVGFGVGSTIGSVNAWQNGENILTGGLHGGFLGAAGGKAGQLGHEGNINFTTESPWGEPVGAGGQGGKGVAPELPTERPGVRPSSEVPTEKAPFEPPTEKAGGSGACGEIPTEKAPFEPPTEKAGGGGSSEPPTEKGYGSEPPTEKIGGGGSEPPTEKAPFEPPTEKAGGPPSDLEPTEKAGGPGRGGQEPDVPFSNEEPLTPAQEAEINRLSKLSKEQLEQMAEAADARGDETQVDLINEALGKKQLQGGEPLAEPLDLANRQAEVDRLSQYSVENLKKLQEYHRSRGETAEADLIGDALKKRTQFGSPSGGIEPEVERLSQLSPEELDRRLAIARANGDPNVTKYLEAAKTLQHQRASSAAGGMEPDYGGLDDAGPSGGRPGGPSTPPESTPPEPPPPPETPPGPVNAAEADYYARNYRPSELQDLLKYHKYHGNTAEAQMVEAAIARQQANGLDQPWSTPPAEGPQPEVLPGAKNRPPGVKADPIDLNNPQAEIKKLAESRDIQHLNDLEKYYRAQGDNARADLVREARSARIGRALDPPMSPEALERYSRSQKADLEWDLKQAQMAPKENAQRIKDIQEAMRIKDARDAAAASAEATDPNISRPGTSKPAGPADVTDANISRPGTSKPAGPADVTDANISRPGTSKPAGPGDVTDPNIPRPGASKPAGPADVTDPNIPRPGTSKPAGPGDVTDPNIPRPKGAVEQPSNRPGEPTGDTPDELKSSNPDFNAARKRLDQAEANLKAAQASGDQRRIEKAAENFENAKRDYTQSDPRRAYRAAVDERQQAQSETAAADKAATDARSAANKAARAADADPQNTQLQEQAKQARAEAEKARLANIEAEQRRIRAGEEERAAADRLRDHLTKEAKLKEKIDSGIQKDFDAPGNDRKGGMRVVADSDEMRVQQKEFKRTEQEWYPTTGSPEVPPNQQVGDGVLGINDRNTNRSMGLPDEGALTHERLHANTSQNWKDNLGGNKTLNEGMTHSMTIEKGETAGAGGARGDADWMPGVPKAYPAEVQVVRKLESVVGKDVMRDAYFKGNTENLMAEVGKRAGAATGREIEVGRDYLTKIDTLTRMAQDAKLAPAQKATAERHLATLLNQLGGKP